MNFYESLHKRFKENMLAQEQRYESLGLTGVDSDERPAVDAIDRLYKNGGLDQPKGFDPPRQVIFCDSPLALCLIVQAVKRIISGDATADNVLRKLDGEVDRAIDDRIWAGAQASLSKVHFAGLTERELSSIVKENYWIVHYVGKTIECESRFWRRDWHNKISRSAGRRLKNNIDQVLGDKLNGDIGPSISAWILINQRAFDTYLHSTLPRSYDPEDDGIYNGYLLESNEITEQRRDDGLFGVEQRCHLLYPASVLCFVSRKPTSVELYVESSRRRGKPMIEYRDGFGVY